MANIISAKELARRANCKKAIETAKTFNILGWTWRECITQGWVFAKTLAALKAGIVKFKFRKVDGTIREAVGTLCVDFLPSTPVKGYRKPNDTIQVYYDIEKGEFRSFKKANLIEVMAA